MPTNDQQENLSLRSEEVQEILTKPPSWIIRWGITFLFILTFIFFSLTFIIQYPDFVSATAIITTKKPTESVVVRHSGSIDKIFVNDKDTVSPGKRLAVIRNTANTNDVDLLKRKLKDVTIKSLRRLSFPIQSTSSLVLGDIEAAYLNFEEKYINYKLQKNLESYSDQIMTNEKMVSELERRLDDKIVENDIQQEAFDLKKSNFERYKQLFQKGVISIQEFEEKKLELLEIKRQLRVMAISISQLKEQISIAYQNNRNTVYNKEEGLQELETDLIIAVNNLRKSIRDWEYEYVLKSSIYGVLSFQDFWGANQYINSGETVFSILPVEQSNLMGKMKISSQNAGKVSIGQKVLIKLNNFPYQEFGIVTGRIKNISISPNKEGMYFIYISLPNGTTTSYNMVLPLKQELIGTAEIITEDLSIAERIFYKFKSLF